MSHSFDPGNAQGEGIFGLPHSPEQAATVLIPVPWDATASYGKGAALGPQAILKASPHLDLMDRQTGRPYEPGIAMLPIPEQVESWNRTASPIAAEVVKGDLSLAAEINALSTKVDQWVHKSAAEWLSQGKIVGLVGGDHSSPLGMMRAVGETVESFGILHIDAHCDLRNAYQGMSGSHASIMYNALETVDNISHLVQVGIRDYAEEEIKYADALDDKVAVFFDADLKHDLMEGKPWNRTADDIVSKLPQNVYVSFDIDGLDPVLCPNTGTPVPGGLDFDQACALLQRVASTGRRIVGFDLCEVAPGPDGNEWDGNVGARVLYKLIGFSLLARS